MSSPEKTSAIGQPLRRKEDQRLVTGSGRFSADADFPGQVFAAMVRSPHAHALIRSVDATVAKAMPGVLAVLTAADMTADAIGILPHTP